MKPTMHQLCCLCLFLCLAASETPADSLDSTIQYHAFKTLTLTKRPRTGIVYNVPLPRNLTGVMAAVIRMRSSTLWQEGVRLRSFYVPPGTITIPGTRRIIIVYQDLGNWSESYYKIRHYTLLTPVNGLLAYDANSTLDNVKLDFRVTRDHIIAEFSRISSSDGKCVVFEPSRSYSFYNVTAKSECLGGNGGHFGIAAPRVDVEVPDEARMMTSKRKWLVWAIMGVVGLTALCLVVALVVRVVKTRMRAEMGRRAENGEMLETVWVSGSKMPSAIMSRTQPVIEEGSAP